MEPGLAPAPVAGGYKFLGFLVGKQRNCVSCRTYLHCILSGCVSPFIKQLKHSSIDILFSLWEEQNIGRDNCDAKFPVKLFVVTCGRGSHAMSRDTLVTSCLSSVSPLHLAILPLTRLGLWTLCRTLADGTIIYPCCLQPRPRPHLPSLH